MGAKGKGKKSSKSKVNVSKLTNKRLNRLAKQGKLKKALPKKRLVELLKRRTNQPEFGQEVPEDIPLEEADYEYFAKPGRDLSFLKDIANSDKNKTKTKKRKHDDDDGFKNVEGLYEKRQKTASVQKDVEVKELLPFKQKGKGVIARSMEVAETQAEPDAGEGIEEAHEPQKFLTPLEEVIQEELKIKEAKQQIRLLSENLIQNPQEHVSTLKEMLSFVENKDTAFPLTVRKFAIAQLTNVYKDIIPGYRIRALTDKEKQQAMKKEKKQVIAFEDTLVSSYASFLDSLSFLATGKRLKKKSKDGDKKARKDSFTPNLRSVSVASLCELLVTHPHFNHRTEIISIVMRFIVDSRLSDTVCDAVKQLFEQDRSGEVSLEIVRVIGRIIKVRNYKVKPKVLDTFLSLKIKEIEKPEDKVKEKMTKDEKKKKFSRRERKNMKAMEHLDKELRDAAAEQDVKRRIKLHTEVVNAIFLTYFRILKLARSSGLLASVLEGLAKFAHLINVSFFDDLFAVLTELVMSGELSNRCSLNCIQAALTLLMGQGEALNIDPMRFYNHLYKVLLQLHAGNSTADLPIVLRCLDVLVNKRRRHTSEQRLLAFLKRLATLTLQMSSDGGLALLKIVRNIISECPRSAMLLTTETIGCGIYLPEIDEPDHCNAMNSSLFELHLLRKSYHPGVKNFAKELILAQRKW